MKTYILVNDTEPSQHLGCVLVVNRIRGEFASRGAQMVDSVNTKVDAEKTLSSEDWAAVDFVVFNGEGTLHHDAVRGLEMLDFAVAAKAAGKPVFLINSVWQANGETYGERLGCFDLCCFREPLSLADAKAIRSDCRLVPDLTIAAPRLAGRSALRAKGRGIVRRLCGRFAPSFGVVDSVRKDVTEKLGDFAISAGARFFAMSSYGLSHLSNDQLEKIRRIGDTTLTMDNLGELEGCDLVVTGRFHAACLLLESGTPFFAIASNTYKIEGLLDDAGVARGEILLGEDWLALDPAAQRRELIVRKGAVWAGETEAKFRAYLRKAARDQAAMFDDIARLAGLGKPGEREGSVS